VFPVEPTTGPAEQGLLQAELAPAPDVCRCCRSGPLLPSWPFRSGAPRQARSCSAVSSMPSMTSLPMHIPGTSWWARAVVESTLTRDKSVPLTGGLSNHAFR